MSYVYCISVNLLFYTLYQFFHNIKKVHKSTLIFKHLALKMLIFVICRHIFFKENNSKLFWIIRWVIIVKWEGKKNWNTKRKKNNSSYIQVLNEGPKSREVFPHSLARHSFSVVQHILRHFFLPRYKHQEFKKSIFLSHWGSNCQLEP